jgi:AraC family transcriptional regulator
MRAAVERAISAMWDQCAEPLTLDDLAGVAMLSRFYFAHVFQTWTGTSPGRFLAAVRLSRAKHLLLETSLSATAVCYGVGYNSTGMFTNRFTRSVGYSPARYRKRALAGTAVLFPVPVAGCSAGCVAGRLLAPDLDQPVRVYVGAFAGPIPEGCPAALEVVEGMGSFRLAALPPGSWYLHAVGVAARDVDARPWRRRPVLVGRHGPVPVRGGERVDMNVELHPARLSDPPVLTVLPELDNWGSPAVQASGTELWRSPLAGS